MASQRNQPWNGVNNGKSSRSIAKPGCIQYTMSLAKIRSGEGRRPVCDHTAHSECSRSIFRNSDLSSTSILRCPGREYSWPIHHPPTTDVSIANEQALEEGQYCVICDPLADEPQYGDFLEIGSNGRHHFHARCFFSHYDNSKVSNGLSPHSNLRSWQNLACPELSDSQGLRWTMARWGCFSTTTRSIQTIQSQHAVLVKPLSRPPYHAGWIRELCQRLRRMSKTPMRAVTLSGAWSALDNRLLFLGTWAIQAHGHTLDQILLTERAAHIDTAVSLPICALKRTDKRIKTRVSGFLRLHYRPDTETTPYRGFEHTVVVHLDESFSAVGKASQPPARDVQSRRCGHPIGSYHSGPQLQ
ncbi:hypothetical protein EK21DRAFT_87991 [Setomelanomma holmii]|uniref:Uncharacterized protein n=1 Tax=Setomelanomma holmii TaxID=210430 RepID=A0A9P4HD37_9PLEO|nr:hypothetical protein EK21DRAFT_87991 [Setomelanomma holmii]